MGRLTLGRRARRRHTLDSEASATGRAQPRQLIPLAPRMQTRETPMTVAPRPICPDCHAVVPDGAPYCPTCGHPLDPALSAEIHELYATLRDLDARIAA